METVVEGGIQHEVLLRSGNVLKNLVFYTVAGSVIAFMAQMAGVSLPVVLLLSLTGPPAILLAIAILRYKGII